RRAAARLRAAASAAAAGATTSTTKSRSDRRVGAGARPHPTDHGPSRPTGAKAA
ncbi:MAG: hypothetical protein ACJA1L_002997, partial [Paracoccaceae bacterium]